MTRLIATKEWACMVCGRVIEKEEVFYMGGGEMKCEPCKDKPLFVDKKPAKKGFDKFFIK